jgi:hypothetical protein
MLCWPILQIVILVICLKPCDLIWSYVNLPHYHINKIILTLTAIYAVNFLTIYHQVRVCLSII